MTTYPLTVTAGNAKTTASLSVQRLYGVNTGQHATVTPALSGITFTKLFVPATGVPPSWPGNTSSPIPPGTQTLVCFKPDPRLLLAGKLDAQITGFLKHAPKGSWLTAWQEANDPSTGFWAAAGTKDPAVLGETHAYLHTLVAKVAPWVRYGQDFGGWPIYHGGQDCTAYSAPGLGFYSFDGYSIGNERGAHAARYTPAQVFAGLGQVHAKWPGCPVAITETNTDQVTSDPSAAGAWFEGVYEVAQAFNVILFSTWWGNAKQANVAQYAFSPSAPYVGVLNKIAADCGA